MNRIVRVSRLSGPSEVSRQGTPSSRTERTRTLWTGLPIGLSGWESPDPSSGRRLAALPWRRDIMKADEIDVLAFAVLRHFQ